MYKGMSQGHESLQLCLHVVISTYSEGVTLACPKHVNGQVKEWKHEG